MPGGVSVGRNEDELAIAKDVVFTVNKLVVERVIEVFGVKAIFLGYLGVVRPLHLVLLHQESRAGKELITPGVVEVKVRIDDILNVIRSHPQTGELADDLVSILGAVNKDLGQIPQASFGIVDGLAMYTGVKEDVSLGVGDEIAGHRHRPACSFFAIRKKEGAVKLQISTAHGIDLQHASPPLVTVHGLRFTVYGYCQPSTVNCLSRSATVSTFSVWGSMSKGCTLSGW